MVLGVVGETKNAASAASFSLRCSSVNTSFSLFRRHRRRLELFPSFRKMLRTDVLFRPAAGPAVVSLDHAGVLLRFTRPLSDAIFIPWIPITGRRVTLSWAFVIVDFFGLFGRFDFSCGRSVSLPETGTAIIGTFDWTLIRVKERRKLPDVLSLLTFKADRCFDRHLLPQSTSAILTFIIVPSASTTVTFVSAPLFGPTLSTVP